jgi:hypothetical protein
VSIVWIQTNADILTEDFPDPVMPIILKSVHSMSVIEEENLSTHRMMTSAFFSGVGVLLGAMDVGAG